MGQLARFCINLTLIVGVITLVVRLV